MRVASSIRLGAAILALVAILFSSWRLLDRDRDGVWSRWRTAVDCDDDNPYVYPGALEVPLNGIDEDCDGFDSTKGSNIVLITIDALRARNLGAYGYFRDTSPNIDEIAREGVLFTNAFSQSSWTVPSLASLLSSAYPSQHNAFNGPKGTSSLDGSIPILTDVLRDAGYETGAFISSAYPLLKLGFERGFDTYQKGSDQRTREIKAWIGKRRDRRFFIWIHYFKPHIPYFPSRDSDKMFIEEGLAEYREMGEFWNKQECRDHYSRGDNTARIRMGFYDENIRDSDRRVGEIMGELDRLGLTDRTLVVVSSDHGDEFFEHGGCDHGWTLYDEVIHVPLIMRHPLMIDPGTVTEEQVRTVDVAPTILDVVGVPVPREFMGTSLVEHLRGEGEELPVFSGYLINGKRLVSLREDGFKFVYSPREKTEELYDLENDPEEKENVVQVRTERAKRLRQRLMDWVKQTRGSGSRKTVEFEEETKKKLRALGYTAAD